MDFKEAIGAIVAGVALLVPAIKWLISDWAKKAEEIEKLKSSNTSTAILRLEDDLRDFRATVNLIQNSIRNLEIHLTGNKAQIEILKEHLKSTVKSLDQYAKDLDTNLGNKIKTELIELSKRAALIRNKKDGD